MNDEITRRRMLWQSTLVAGTCAGPVAAATGRTEKQPMQPAPWRFCLNTSTIRGQGLGIVEEIELAARAGYDGIEPWIREIDEYVQQGGRLDDLRKRIEDSGLKVESAIAFAAWMVDDPEERKQGLKEARRTMEIVRAIGGTRIAAPPAGEKDQAVDLGRVAERYAELLELGRATGVVPHLEIWGFSRTIGNLASAVFVTVASGHPDARLLPDVYHLYKGGSQFESLGLISGHAIEVFHMNDYPADPPRETIRDEHRVYPGDGIAPLAQIVGDLKANGFQGALSLELFNRQLWEQDAEKVARTGLEKMRSATIGTLK